MAIATFGKKQFVVSKNMINTLDEIAFSQALNVETQEVEGKKPHTLIKGIELIPLSFSILLNSRFIDVLKEIKWWRDKVLSKSPEVFTLGGKVISKYKFLLKSISVSETLIGKNGTIVKAKLNIELEEYVSSGNNSVSKKSTSKKKTTANKISASEIKAIEEAVKK